MLTSYTTNSRLRISFLDQYPRKILPLLFPVLRFLQRRPHVEINHCTVHLVDQSEVISYLYPIWKC